ncbi:MAG: GumC family protein [Gemmatimonadaceae bacterium]
MLLPQPDTGSPHNPLSITPGTPHVGVAGWPGGGSRRQEWAEPDGIPWLRYVDVLKRHVPLIIGLTVGGSALGFIMARRIAPLYDVQATVWINTEKTANTQTGPIRVQQQVPSTSWVELARSFALVDPIVRRLHLNVFYPQHSDSVLFRSFESLATLRPGAYTLKIDDRGRRYTLSDSRDVILERGVVGDTRGRRLGFLWAPEKRLLTPGRAARFVVATPRSTSAGLVRAMRPFVAEEGQFLRIALGGGDPQRIAATVNAWADQLVRSSVDLKKRHLFEFEKALGEQLGLAASQLSAAETRLEQFRVQTITLPSGGSPSAAAQGAVDPLMSNYFQQKLALDEVRSDREALERLIAEAAGGPLNTQGFLQLPSILNNAPQLRAAIDELSSRQATLRTEQQYLTDANPRIKQLAEAVRVLEHETIPRIADGVVKSLRAREPALSQRIDAESSQLRAIPSRTTEQMRLMRQVAASENLYNTLKARYEEVSMAEAQTTPDLSVLDTAVAPTRPSSNEAPRMLFLAVIASIGLAIGIALVRDRFDRHFRYPEQATRELGLTIAGTVPRFKPNRHGVFHIDTMSQAVESFRTLRLALRYDFPGDVPIVFGVSSPAKGDGKSLVSANLALAFANAGNRTLLIDGDIRCGSQHSTFDTTVTPGLVEYLHGAAGLDDIVRSTSSDNLFLIPRGTRRNRAPELLVSELMGALILAVRRQFDVVIIDSPPLVAGMDAYALGAAAGSMLLVLRPAVTDRKLAAAKLEVVDRLPIRVLGAVINSIKDEGAYRYYGNGYKYADTDTPESISDLATPKGLVLRA